MVVQSNSNLSDSQIERLRSVMGSRVNPGGQASKKVSREEYLRRLHEDHLLDSQLAEQSRQDNIQKNIDAWNQRIESRWRGALLENTRNSPESIAKVSDKINRWETGQGMNQLSMLLTGALGRGKTWTAYMYVTELIHRGILTEGQVYMSTESALAAIATSGFEKEKRFKEVLSPKYRFYFIDDIGRGAFGNSESARGEVWFELLNHVYNNQIAFVGTTNLSVFPPRSPANAPSRLEGWIGKAAFERLRHMVGESGFIFFSEETKNMRHEMGAEWEAKYSQSQRQR